MNIVLFLWGLVFIPIAVILFYTLALAWRPFYSCFYTPLLAAVSHKDLSEKFRQICVRGFRIWAMYLLIIAFYAITGGALGNLMLSPDEVANSFSFGVFLGALIASCARIIALSATGIIARGLIHQTLIFTSIVLLFIPMAIVRAPYKTIWNLSFITLFQDDVIAKYIPNMAFIIIACTTLVFLFTEFLVEVAKRFFLVLKMSPVSLFREMVEGSDEKEISFGRDTIIETGRRVIENVINTDRKIISIDWFTQSADNKILDKIIEMSRFLELLLSGLNRPDARNFAREMTKLQTGRREDNRKMTQQAEEEIEKLKKEAINSHTRFAKDEDIQNFLKDADAKAQSLVSMKTRIITTQDRKNEILEDFNGWFARDKVGVSGEFGNRRFLIINEKIALPSTPIPPMDGNKSEFVSNISAVIDSPYWVHCIVADFRHMWRIYNPVA